MDSSRRFSTCVLESYIYNTYRQPELMQISVSSLGQVLWVPRNPWIQNLWVFEPMDFQRLHLKISGLEPLDLAINADVKPVD